MSLVPLLVTVAWTGQGGAADLADLDAGTRESIARACLPVQYAEGARAYRNCVTERVATYASAANASLDALSFDERYAIERACDGTAEREDAAGCIAGQLTALEGTSEPFLDDLGEDERHALRRQCFGVQGGEGVAAYRRCIRDALASLRALPVPDLSALTLLERNELGSRCSTAEDTAAGHRRCLLGARQAVGGDSVTGAAETGTRETPVRSGEDPPVTTVPEAAAPGVADDIGTVADERVADERVADGRGTEAVPIVGSADDGREPSVADAPPTRVVTLPPRLPIDADATSPALAAAGPDATPSIGAASPAAAAGVPADIEVAAIDIASEEIGDAAGGPTDDTDADGESDTGIGEDEAAAADGEATEPGTEPAPDVGQRLGDAWERLETTVSGLQGIERLVLGAAIALPLLLLAFWASRRGSHASEPDRTPQRNALVERLEPTLYRGGHDRTAAPSPVAPGPRRGGRPFDASADDTLDRSFDEVDASGSFAAAWRPDEPEDALDLTSGRTDLAGPTDRDDHDDHDDRADRSGRSDRGTDRPAAPATSGIADRVGPDGATPLPAAAPRSAFGRRLRDEADPALARQQAIELLVYWMAYADERYEPAMRDELLRADPADDDEHRRIKRHALDADADVFADTVGWLQREASELERVQVIDLLMVLLIVEGTMTPVQNTLLRFLADAFGLGVETLDERHEFAFGTPMPALPRVDLPAWWRDVEPDRLLRWDARAVAELDEHQRFRVLLGLPLSGEIGEGEIVEGFRRAARRCHPHRFDALGERERALAERQFGKFEEARDRLLGVNA